MKSDDWQQASLCRIWALAIPTACWLCGSAPAQRAEEPSVKLPPVVVVGTNFFEESATQRVPLAVTTLPGDRLEQVAIFSTVNLPRAVPNLAQGHAGLRSYSDNYVVRGIGNTEFLSDAAVVLYVDDAPFGSPLTCTTDLLAIDRIEVYRGPQGTRFGKNAEAGVINIITRQPTDRFEAQASGSIATFDTQQYRASAQGPVVKDKLHFSLAGQYALSDGFIRNTFLRSDADEREAINARGSLHWRADDNWDGDFTATADKFDDGLGIVSLNGDSRQSMSEFAGKLEEDVNSQSLRVRGRLGGLALASITSRHDFRLDPFKLDPDFSPLTGNTGVVKYAQPQWTEELRVRPVSPDERWDWRAGFFFSTAETEIDRIVDFFVPPLGLSGRDINHSTQSAETYALFGECTHTTWEKLDVTFGMRLDYSVRALHRTRISTLGSPPPVRGEDGFFNAAPKLSLGYHASDALLIYGSTGLGFKPGGFSPFIDPPASPRFDTETTWANEIGVKSTWLNGRVTANMALFYYEVTDYQVEQFTPTGFDFIVVNAPEARSLGAELELTARPAAGWELSGFFGYTHARLDRYTNPFTGAKVSDTRPPFVAEFNGGVAAQYKHKTGLFGRLEFVATGDTFYDVANTSSFKQSAYGLLNARVGFEREHFGIFFFGENLTDTEYFTKKIPPLNAGAPGRPQTFGVMLVARY